MLRRVNSALFEAPRGARIQVVVESQGNNGVNDARFEYGGSLLAKDMILGLPGCSFTVAGTSQRLEAGVVFDPGASGSARYDMFEVENGVKSDLGKSVKNSNATPLIAFTIDPVPVAAAVPARAAFAAKPALAKRPEKAAKKTARKKPPQKKRKPAPKATSPRKKAAKTAPKKATAPKRKARTASRKRSR